MAPPVVSGCISPNGEGSGIVVDIDVSGKFVQHDGNNMYVQLTSGAIWAPVVRLSIWTSKGPVQVRRPVRLHIDRNNT